MELNQTFTVPVPLDAAWKALNDPERIAPCMPGATLEWVEGDAFSGSVKVKLGPIGLTYRGKARFVQAAPESGTVVIEGTGKDAKGNGSASATVTAHLTESAGLTTVATTTDLNITGKPAQFGRGVMNDVANKIVAQFAGNLAMLLTSDETTPVSVPAASTTGPTENPAATSSSPAAARTPVAAPAAADIDAFSLLGVSATVRQRLAAALVLVNVFVLGWAVGRLGNRR